MGIFYFSNIPTLSHTYFIEITPQGSHGSQKTLPGKFEAERSPEGDAGEGFGFKCVKINPK